MTTRITYIACDGEEFETEQECLEYEKSMDSTDCLMMFDNDLNVLRDEDQGRNAEYSNYIYILDAEKAMKFFKWASINYGYTFPDNVETGRLYSYDDRSDSWEDMNEKVDMLVKRRDYLLKKVERLRK